MIWSRSSCLALAGQSCTFCYGLGLRPGRAGNSNACNCVFRAIFRACHQRFRQCASKQKCLSRVSLEANPGRQRKCIWGLKNEEYIADFVLASKRALRGDPLAQWIFKFHCLYGAPWKPCCAKLKIDRGEFFHEVYRIQQKLGRYYAELEPYALWPLDEYFGGTDGRRRVEPESPRLFVVSTDDLPIHAPIRRLRFPLTAKAAG